MWGLVQGTCLKYNACNLNELYCRELVQSGVEGTCVKCSQGNIDEV